MTLGQTLGRWLFGERFYLRSPLNEDECKRRIGLYSSGAFVPSVTNDPVATWKGSRVYVWMSFQRRSPWLVGKLRSTGETTEIVGRAGGDFLSLWAAVGVEALIVWVLLIPIPADPVLWSLLLVPIAVFLLRRRSPHAGQLIDFLKQLLDAEDVLARKGDPIIRV